MMKNISRLKQWHRLIALLALCLSLTAGNSQPAFASVHTYPESPTQVMYRSLQTLRDATDKAWQTVLYKRLKSSQLDSVRLRLVGFPGIGELAGTAPLRIATGTGVVWTAPDVWADSSLPANVGEYDFLQVMAQLDSDTPLRLSLPLKNSRPVELLVPPNAFARVAESFPAATNHTQPTAIKISLPPPPFRGTFFRWEAKRAKHLRM
jgi:hypothetical protein